MGTRRKGQHLVFGPEDGKSYWQPEPADGYATIKLSPENCESNAMAAGFQVIDPGGQIRPHAHARNEELLFVWEGTGVAEVEGERTDVEPGSLVYVSRWVEHTIINTGEVPLKVLWVITPPGLEDFFAAVGRPRQGGEPAPASFGRPENAQELVDAAHFARPEVLAEISPK